MNDNNKQKAKSEGKNQKKNKYYLIGIIVIGLVLGAYALNQPSNVEDERATSVDASIEDGTVNDVTKIESEGEEQKNQGSQEEVDETEDQDSQDQVDGTENQGSQEEVDGTEHQDSQEEVDGTENQGSQEQVDGTENQDSQEEVDGTENQGSQEQVDGTENQGSQEEVDGTENQGSQEQVDGTENQGSQIEVTVPDKIEYTVVEKLVYLNISSSTSSTINLKGLNHDLGGQIIEVNQSVTIVGPGKLINGEIRVHDINYVNIKDVEMENVHISVKNSKNTKISNNVFEHVNADVLGFISIESGVEDLMVEGNTFYDIDYVTNGTKYGSGIKMEVSNGYTKNVSILNNTFSYIRGPAAIWIGGSNTKIESLNIKGNTIHDTESFGIEFFQYGDGIVLSDTHVNNNKISDIGSIRERNDGSGCGGIFSNLNSKSVVYVDGNDIRRVTEVGIEGYYTSVSNNYIKDTGSNQLSRPIDDSAGIYMMGPEVVNNTIVNPGSYGGIHCFTFGVFRNRTISGNTIINSYTMWKANTSYAKGDLVVANEQWYVCTKAGVSGATAISGRKASIVDGGATWNYKKPLSEYAIHINAVEGIENMLVKNNTATDFKYFNMFSAFIDNITIVDNAWEGVMLPIEQQQFITGYGNRTVSNSTIVNLDDFKVVPETISE